MTTFIRFCACALLLAACGDDDGTTDAGADTGIDGGRPDTGAVDVGRDAPAPGDAGPDTGPLGCEEECEIVELGVGSDYVCGRRANGAVLCWGGNINGQLGDNRMRHTICGMTGVEPRDCSPTPVTVEGITALSMGVGSFGACALQENIGEENVLYCWGLTDIPPMGLDARQREFEPLEEVDFPMIEQVDRGASNTCVIGLSGGVRCRGDNESGQLGNGTFMESITPVQVMSLTGIEEMDVSAGGEFVCARTIDTVYCWGSNSANQFGDATTHEVCGLAADSYDCSSTPVEAGIDGSMVEQIALGEAHMCARLSDGTVSCWGANYAGQTGTDTSGADVATPTPVPGVTGAIEIVAGPQHTCAISVGGEMKCWGRNDEGQLGDGSIDHATCTFGESFDCSPTPVPVEFAGEWVHAAAGSRNTCGIDAADQVHCWGWNEQRQLGPDGPSDRSRSATPVAVSGLE